MSNSKKIKHLYSRAGFGLSPKEWERKRDWTIKEANKSLFDKAQNATIRVHSINYNFGKKDIAHDSFSQ